MEVSARWRAGVSFEVTGGTGHKVITDGPPEHGGGDAGLRPMELLLASAAACSAYDVVTILRKGRQAFTDVRVTVRGTRADGIPAVFTRIELDFAIPGAQEGPARRAVQLSVDKYCSALRMLAQAAAIGWSLEIPAD